MPSAEVLNFFCDKLEKSIYETSIAMDMSFIKRSEHMRQNEHITHGANPLPNPVSMRR